jgi:hypothetical protein
MKQRRRGVVANLTMKARFSSIVSAVALAGATAFSLRADPVSATPKASTTVEFFEPDKFTDFKTSLLGSESERSGLEAEFRREISRKAESYLPAGYHLDIRFRDIDMAGNFEPVNRPPYDQIRVVRQVYPPRLQLTYRLTDTSGEIVSSGDRTLTDPNFQGRLRLTANSSTVYESELIDDFVRELARSVAST